jgi:transcription elongation factor Elf1
MTDSSCPFCGSTNIELRPRRGAYDNDAIYCNGCKTVFTYYPTHIGHVWNRRTKTDGEHCPFCGGEVEFDGLMNYSQFHADAYCPTCGWRIEFQGTKAAEAKTKTEEAIRKARERTIAKAREAFARRTSA